MATKQPCPQCAALAASVTTQTIQHQLKQPWLWQADKSGYYFCASPACRIVYFSVAGDIIHGEALRQTVGIKSMDDSGTDNSALICYCFDVSLADAKASPDAKAYVMAQTKQKLCACHVRNPSGQCCLKDFAMVEGVL